MDIWALPMVELMHIGSYIFQGSLVEMAQANVHATISPEDVEKMQKRGPVVAHKNNS